MRQQAQTNNQPCITWEISESLFQDATLQLNRIWLQSCAPPACPSALTEAAETLSIHLPGGYSFFSYKQSSRGLGIPSLHPNRLIKRSDTPAGSLLSLLSPVITGLSIKPDKSAVKAHPHMALPWQAGLRHHCKGISAT